ncbi:hypothetical protein LWC33_31920 [Pseudonocardia sp. RS11V-5]|uniref:hypothetical protein n=1 Tax=Pseudonocardia terrae TaxID=2905831 RepID=UPI001E4B7E83|nr:hypothetical protein [Pseudonocardia terrae]MCE3556037.1 hypothetical protein [Pseudonocardia terrae]
MRLRRRRPREVDLYLPMKRIEHLFEAPRLDPFAPELEHYDPRPGLEQMVRAVQRAKRKATLSVALGLPADVITPGLEERARAALARECRRRIALLDDDVAGVRRLGIRTLLWGLLAVLFINGAVGALGTTEPGSIEDALSTGLQTVAWVVLWVPINLLIYDLWYYRRDRRAYRRLRDLALTVVPQRPAKAGLLAPPPGADSERPPRQGDPDRPPETRQETP